MQSANDKLSNSNNRQHRDGVSAAGSLYLESRHRFITLILQSFIVAVTLNLIATHAGADSGLIRVGGGRQSYEGKIVALTASTCCLMDRQGKLVSIPVASLNKFEKLAERFTPASISVLRDELLREFPGRYEVAGTTHYLVCAPVGKASQYGQLFESIYRDVEQFYRVRRFDVRPPEVPLVAVVFGTQAEFFSYCYRDHVPPSPTLRGYYSLNTNRVALYDDSALISGAAPVSSERNLNLRWTSSARSLAKISGDTHNTIVHETTHQVSYNIGIHSRLGGTPVWISEGLATVLEPVGMRSRSGRQLLDGRINTERAVWFQERHRPSRHSGNLALLVASDDFFYRETLNSYSEAWAFTFFLLENPSRRQDLVKYLQLLAGRDPLKEYSPKERLSDFKDVFGDVARLEVEFIRFMDRM